MNKTREERLHAISGEMEEVKTALKKISAKASAIQSSLEAVADDEESARDSMPENLQTSYRYERSESCSESIDDAIESIDDAIQNIQSAINSLDEI